MIDIEFTEVFLTEDIEALLTPEQIRQLKLKKDTLYMVKGKIASIEEVDEAYIAKAFTPVEKVTK